MSSLDTHIDETTAWEIYNLINRWKAGEYGPVPLADVLSGAAADDSDDPPGLCRFCKRYEGLRITGSTRWTHYCHRDDMYVPVEDGGPGNCEAYIAID